MEKIFTGRQKHILRYLATLSNDSRKGFIVAVESINNPTLKEILLDYSTQRTMFAVELKKIMAGNGHKPSITGSLAGLLHRGWMHMKAFFMRNDTESMIAECLLAEKYFLRKIERAERRFYTDEILQLFALQKRETKQCMAVLNATLEFLPTRNAVIFDKTIHS